MYSLYGFSRELRRFVTIYIHRSMRLPGHGVRLPLETHYSEAGGLEHNNNNNHKKNKELAICVVSGIYLFVVCAIERKRERERER